MTTSTGSPGCVIGIDFGNTTTKVAIHHESAGMYPVPVAIPGYSRDVPLGGGAFAPVIPSVLHYALDGSVLVGMQVIDREPLDEDGTVRWMAHYTSLGSPARFRVERGPLSFQDAAADFLSSIIRRTGELYPVRRSDLVIAVPAGSREMFMAWLPSLATGEIVSRVRIIEQPSAITSACLPDSRSPDTFMIIDFGGSSLEVFVATSTGEDDKPRTRILGRASGNFGGNTIDRLLLRWLLHQIDLHNPGQELTKKLLEACQQAKESLSTHPVTPILADGRELVRITRNDFEELLEKEGIFARYSSVLEQAVNSAAARGYTENSVSAVILAGGSGAIPSFQSLVEGRFGSARLVADQPILCGSRGAAAWPQRTSPEDQITHTYAVRVWNPDLKRFELQPIIRRGCPVPSNGTVTRIRIQATYDGQTRLGIPIYQLTAPGQGCRHAEHREITFGPTGPILLEEGDQPPGEQPRGLWINEKDLIFVPADPPAMRGEPRFEIGFSVGASGELLVSAKDLGTGKRVLENAIAVILR
jgi:molecular chaperone DnaK (HSP70)